MCFQIRLLQAQIDLQTFDPEMSLDVYQENPAHEINPNNINFDVRGYHHTTHRQGSDLKHG